MTILDTYQAIDEIVMQYVGGSLDAVTAMEYIAEMIADEENR